MAQSDAHRQIASALSSGNADALAEYFGSEVQLGYLDDEMILSAAGAKSKLRKIFASNKPISFTPRHKGGSQANRGNYMIGNLLTEQLSYRVFVYTESNSTRTTISEIRFEESL